MVGAAQKHGNQEDDEGDGPPGAPPEPLLEDVPQQLPRSKASCLLGGISQSEWILPCWPI